MLMQQKKIFVAWLSVVSNSLLVTIKVITGLLIGSVAIISEGIHSGIDLIASGIALWAVHHSHKPADQGHPFGHGKIENISGAVEAALIFIAAGWIIVEAVKKLLQPRPIEELSLGVFVMLVSCLVNYLISQLLFKIGRESQSVALQADAWHLRTDVYTSAGVLIGLVLIWGGERLLTGIHLHWIDPVAAIVVAMMILQAAFNLTRQSLHDLLDAGIPPDEEQWLRERIAQFCPDVRGFHHLRARKTGPVRFVDVHVLVDGKMTVNRSHRIADQLENEIEARFPGSSVTVHMEPCTNRCSPVCLSGCLLPDNQKFKQRPLAEGQAPSSGNVPNVSGTTGEDRIIHE